MSGWVVDFRYAVRSLLRRPALGAVAVLTLALGVGANTGLFTVVHGVLLRPFDLPEAERLVVVQDRSTRGGGPYRTTGGAWGDWRRENRTLAELALLGGWTATFTEAGLEPERVNGTSVSASYFDVLGVRPALGRAFRAEENDGVHRVLILSDALWRGRYASDPDIVGRLVTLNQSETWQVIGVMPPLGLPAIWGSLEVVATDREQTAWVPIDLTNEWAAGYRSHVFVALGRLDTSADLADVDADLRGVGADITRREPDLYANTIPDVRSLHDAILGDVRRDLMVLLGAVGLLLLVACANLANLLLARSVERGRELAVRAAVGASAGRLVRLALVEAVLIGLAGGAVGLLAAVASLDALLALLPADLPRASGIAVEGAVFVYALGLSVAAGLLTGIVPALRGARPLLAGSLRSGTRAGASRSGSRAARGLVAAQLALACMLLIGAALLARSVHELGRVDLGAETDNTLAVEFLLVQETDRGQVSAFLRRLEERVEAIPGVRQVSVAYDTPLEASWSESFTVLDRPPPAPGERPGAQFRPVSPGYFEMVGIPVLQGRTLTEGDGIDGAPVVVINQTVADRFFAGEPVLGRRIAMGTLRGIWGADAPGEWEIVGVVADVRMRGPREPAPGAFYFSQRQAPTSFSRLLVKTEGDPLAIVPSVRAAVAELDPQLPLSAVTTLDEARRRATAQDRFNALFLGAFALTALAVAAAGIYGVLAYAVARRTTEMGVRLALGAGPAGVFRMLVDEGARMAGMGLALGVSGAFVGGRALAGLLFGVQPLDPLVYAAVVLALTFVTLIAGAVPACRAARTDPATALREG
jgi:putative ABC transport system permease protein